MRLKLSLTAKDKFFPLNYNYYLSAAIYKLLQFGSKKFSSFLHDIGFQLNGKQYKLFSFALRFNNALVGKNNFRLISPDVMLYISSPLIETFIQNFIIGSLQNQFLEISDGRTKSTLVINQIESLPEQIFQEINFFVLLSPLVLSTVNEIDNKKHQHYFRYYDDIFEINRVMNQNLKNKFKIIYNRDYSGDDLILVWDQYYIKKKSSEGKRLTKKISIPVIDNRPVDIIANEIPFSVTGSKELVNVGYQCGFGEKNSMGFGLADLI